jgi:hypothetical protein
MTSEASHQNPNDMLASEGHINSIAIKMAFYPG